MTEMTASVVALRYEGGKFEELQTLPTAEMAPGVSGAEIAVHPNGKFVYSSTRGANLIDVFAIDAGQGHTDGGGAHPFGRQDTAQLRDRPYGRLLVRRPPGFR